MPWAPTESHTMYALLSDQFVVTCLSREFHLVLSCLIALSFEFIWGLSGVPSNATQICRDAPIQKTGFGSNG